MPIRLSRGRRSRNNLRHLNLCFSNSMQPFTHESPPTTHDTANSSSLLQHNTDHNNHNPPSPTTSSIMIKNFNSLCDYDHTLTLQQHYPLYSSSSSSSLPTTSFEPEPEPEPEPADFATAFASQRFFFSSPGRSNSIVESTTSFSSSSSSSSMATALPPVDAPAASDDNNNNNNKKEAFFNGSVAVPTYSPDPYLDFRRSMEEMVEAHPEVMMDVKSNWEALHELLLSYLALNSRSTHKFILGAFSDLLVTLMSSSSSSSFPQPQNHDPDNVNAGGGGGC